MMREVNEKLLDCLTPTVVVLPTHGYVKNDGTFPMGPKGSILDLARRNYPRLERAIGEALLSQGRPRGQAGGNSAIGNHVCIVLTTSRAPMLTFVTFPIKWNWWEKADLGLIERSAIELDALATVKGWSNVRLPQVGCGEGFLEWKEVRETISPYLQGERYTVCIARTRSLQQATS